MVRRMSDDHARLEPSETASGDPRLFVLVAWAAAAYPVYLACDAYLWVFDVRTDPAGRDTYWPSPLLTVALTVVALAAGVVGVQRGIRLWKASGAPHRDQVALIISVSILIVTTLVIAYSAVVSGA
jgi:hypothetical protein